MYVEGKNLHLGIDVNGTFDYYGLLARRLVDLPFKGLVVMYFRAVFACFALLALLSLGVFGCSSGGGGTAAASAEDPAPLPAPVASFSASPTIGESPLTVQFTNQSNVTAGPGVIFFWRFGDDGGTTSNSENPSFTYTAPGLYTVALTVFTTAGNNTMTRVNFVSALAPPVAEFSAAPSSGPVPLNVFFTNESLLNGAPAATYEWDFGDGSMSTALNPGHEYTVPGLYTVSLTITTLGGSDTNAKSDFVLVFPPPPVANFSASPTNGRAPLVVSFTNLSNLNGASGATYFWSFGDGTSGTAVNPTHTYVTGESFTVSLTVTTLGGTSTNTQSDLILAVVPPTADFTAAPTLGVPPLGVQFTNLSDEGAAASVSYKWDFGDKSDFSNEANPLHTYALPGRYTVSLTITTIAGSNTSVMSDLVELLLAPVANFSADNVLGLAPLDVQFTNTSDLGGAAAATYLWDFGDGDTSVEVSPLHTYTTPGFYTVALSVTTVAGENTLIESSFIEVLSFGGREYYLVFPESFDAPSSELLLLISSKLITSGTARIPNLFGVEFLELFSVFPTFVTGVQIPNLAITESFDQSFNDAVFVGAGMEIKASTPITVYGMNSQTGTTDGFLALPLEALGTEYYVMTWNALTGGQGSLSSEFAIVATEDNTTVTITPTEDAGFFDEDGIFFQTRFAGLPFDIPLNRLDVYQLQTNFVDDDFTGTHIVSNRPIAVFSGNICANVPEFDITACDHLVEQLPPVRSWGTEYVAVSLQSRIGGDSFRIMASEDNTTVTIQGTVEPETITLQKGEFVPRNLPNINRIDADKPIFVAQFANGASFDDPTGNTRALGDPFMMNLVPPERFPRRYTFATPTFGSPGTIFDRNFINIVALTEDFQENRIKISVHLFTPDPDAITPTAGAGTEVPGTDFSVARIELIDPGHYTVTSQNPFGLYIYGFANDNSYGFPGGWAF